MIGLEERLRSVEGVADITIELGEDGLDGIRVRITEGSDEAAVLEQIRRILVAYGLRSRRRGPGGERPLPAIHAEPESPTAPPAPQGGQDPQVEVGSEGGRLVVRLAAGDRRVTATADPSAAGAAEAMVRVVAEWHGLPLPDHLDVFEDRVGDHPLITLVVRRGLVAAAGASVAHPSLTRSLYRAARLALEELAGAGR